MSAQAARAMTAVPETTELQLETHVPEVTLWELIWAVSEVADDEREVVATVAHMLTSGSVRVVGDIRNRAMRFA